MTKKDTTTRNTRKLSILYAVSVMLAAVLFGLGSKLDILTLLILTVVLIGCSAIFGILYLMRQISWKGRGLGCLSAFVIYFVAFAVIPTLIFTALDGYQSPKDREIQRLLDEYNGKKAELDKCNDAYKTRSAELQSVNAQMDTFKAQGQVDAYNALVKHQNDLVLQSDTENIRCETVQFQAKVAQDKYNRAVNKKVFSDG